MKTPSAFMPAWLPAWLLACLPLRLARRCAKLGVKPCTPTGPTQQLLVDVSVIYRSDARTGIQRVVRALLLQLLKAPPPGYEVRPVFATRQHGYSYAAPDFLAVQATEASSLKEAAFAPSLVRVESSDIFLGLDLSAHLLPRHRAQVLSWKRTGVQIHVLVYDLLPLQHPEWFTTKTTRNFKRWIRWLATYADNAICISQTVRSELSNLLLARFGLSDVEVPTARITLGADIAASAPSRGLPPNIEFTLARLRATPSLLMVGTIEPRKGHDQVLAAFDLLQPAPILVIVGRPGWGTDALQQQIRNHPQAGKQIIWFEDASDELLTKLYAACNAVIVASRGEGFGLPLVEAELHGKAVIARDLPVFRELETQKTYYFDGNSTENLINAIQVYGIPKKSSETSCNDKKNKETSESVTRWKNTAQQLAMHIYSGKTHQT